MRRIAPLAVALLALAGCATTDTDHSAGSFSDPEKDLEVCDAYIGGEMLVTSAAIWKSLAADPSGNGIDQSELRVLIGDMQRNEEKASDELVSLLELYNAPMYTLGSIFFEGAANETIDTSNVESDGLAIMEFCGDLGYSFDGS
ncbi:hypothetical protein GCM10011490_24270 [Pseudoclavibacter endophyticus]|uniref:Uncharacterized protein n=1 Tax=Pseudoclavibacter endophyticus TaxID=1778590 RepID=A0A6H9WNS6_9MICO|nr:hypothetical protein [Pseudoclavibacter endophyticus]KAB1648428.1 hypothetical protein F8O04_12140 [Pseudoclavibacter endophyticus]GGA72640.1 hypothetical protein GCM10011490_24270 [Pseudoclavibacter endophyticus]